MMMGPVAEAAFVPTYSVHGIALPFSVIIWPPPLVSVGHVAVAVGSIVGVIPPLLPLEPAPLPDPELPLEAEPAEAPELPLEAEPAEALELPLDVEPADPPELPRPVEEPALELPLLDPEEFPLA